MKTLIKNFFSVLRRFKMATILNILGLSIAFTAFMIILMQLDYDWSFDKSHRKADCIYRVERTFGDGVTIPTNRPLADIFFQSSPHIKAGALVSPWLKEIYFTIDKNGEKVSYLEPMIRVYPEYTDVFEFDMVEGSANALSQPEHVLIPQSIANKLFGNESALNRQLQANDINYTIGGVYKDFPSNTVVTNNIYFPIPKDENAHEWNNNNYELYIRVDAPENSEDLVENFKKNFDTSTLGDDYIWISSVGLRLTPLRKIHFTTDTTYDTTPKASKNTLAVLFAIAIIIIVIAAINFTNFTMALTPARIKNINTRKVLGAEESTLRLSLLTEAVSVSIVSYLLSLIWIHILSFTSVTTLLDADLSLSAHFPLLGVTALIAVCTGTLAGVYPSFYVTSFPPALVLKGSFGLSPKGRKLRNALISVQFITSFALIITTLFMYLQNHYMMNTPLGYEKGELIVMDLNNTVQKSREAFTNQLKTFSGIENVTYAEVLLSSSDQYMSWMRKYKNKDIGFQCLPVDVSFLKVMGIDVPEGRDFREEDKNTVNGVYIFNEKARGQYELEIGEKVENGEIVGFIPDIKFASLRSEIAPMAFYIWGTDNWGITPLYAYIKVKSGANLKESMEHIKKTAQSFDPAYPFNIRFFNEVLNRLYEKEQKTTTLITLFSMLAIFISIVGVFGLVVFDSEYRRKEIGVRKVLGSNTLQIIIMFNKTYLHILCLCFILAVPIAYHVVVRWLDNFAYKTPMYWWVFLIAFAIVSVITVITVTFQNYWVANENPVKSLKTD
ncbi:ABC transporter permease [Parabacteroides faecis]|uniref:ABC transport system permease protein n=1 Tax=Parabacteroides faecis TaxID=1217282 RepID=A0ABR6KT17_9BACT|nr:ABC transporter permease [Parabacteroides faecis]MBB4624533.1 putative ABC transport system permease protein [Parabacteroides faecis]GGK04461.1 ABC transporter permease [Parabacteroides faecis]